MFKRARYLLIVTTAWDAGVYLATSAAATAMTINFNSTWHIPGRERLSSLHTLLYYLLNGKLIIMYQWPWPSDGTLIVNQCITKEVQMKGKNFKTSRN